MKDLIVKTNFEYLETTSTYRNFPGVYKNVIFPGIRYCSGDSVYLNKKGYKHLGSFLSRVGLPASAKPVLEFEQKANNYKSTEPQLFMGL